MASPNCSIPRASPVKTWRSGHFLITGRRTALSRVFCCMSCTLFYLGQTLLVNEWKGSGMMFGRGHAGYAQPKEMKTASHRTESNILAFFFPNTSQIFLMRWTCVHLSRASCVRIDKKKINRCKEEQAVQVNMKLSRLTVLEENPIRCTLLLIWRCAFCLWNLAVNLQMPQTFLNIG